MLPTPFSENSSGNGDMYFLDGSDIVYLRALIDRERKRLQSEANATNDSLFVNAPDVQIVKLDTDLEGRDVVTGSIGSVELPVFKIKFDDETDLASMAKFEALKNPDESDIKLRIFNFYPVKWYSAGGPTYLTVRRSKFGLWLCEKPPYEHKCKALADIIPGNILPDDDNTQLYINRTGNVNIKALSNWMNGGLKISNGKEGLVRYFEDEKSWCWVAADCEDVA